MRLLACLALCLCLWTCNNEEDLTNISSEPLPSFPMEAGGDVQIIQDEFEGIQVVLLGEVALRQDRNNSSLSNVPDLQLRWNFVGAFNRTLDGTLLEFSPVNGQVPIVMQDQEGNLWDLNGIAQSGPRVGAQLEWINSGIGFYFAFGTLYQGPTIYRESSEANAMIPTAPMDWDVPTQTIIDAAGFDGIPALEEPLFVLPDDPTVTNYLREDDIVVGLIVDGEAKAYPHPILDWHEIVNDQIGKQKVSVTYCPLTGTSKVYNRAGLGEETFGVSGLLYDSNLMPYDRNTRSIWLQLEGRSVHGERRGEQLELLSSYEMPWSIWKALYPSTTVLSSNTGISRIYTSYPYGDYRTNNDFIFSSINFLDDRLPAKERVFAVIINGQAKVYRKSDFFDL